MRVSKFALGLGLAIAVFLFYYGRPIGLLGYTKWKLRNSREIWLVPKPLPADSTPHFAGPRMEYLGYEFEAPTSEVKEGKKFKSSVALDFSDCAGMVMIGPSPGSEYIKAIREGAGSDAPYPKDVFGKEATSSDYALRKKILNLTPADVRLISSRQKMIGDSMLLMLKSMESLQFKNGLYSFETPWMRGFQEGDLSKDKGIVIEVFDHGDHLLTLIAARKPGKTCFGQPELNEIIFSLRPAQSSP